MASDLDKLTDAELVAAIQLLGEQAQQITDATATVRNEIDRRRIAAQVPELDEVGQSALDVAVSGAAERAEENRIAEEEARHRPDVVTDG